MIQEKEYLEAKRIVTLYECQQLNISGVIKSVCEHKWREWEDKYCNARWRCSKCKTVR